MTTREGESQVPETYHSTSPWAAIEAEAAELGWRVIAAAERPREAGYLQSGVLVAHRKSGPWPGRPYLLTHWTMTVTGAVSFYSSRYDLTHEDALDALAHRAIRP